jgi:hypothetical protein
MLFENHTRSVTIFAGSRAGKTSTTPGREGPCKTHRYTSRIRLCDYMSHLINNGDHMWVLGEYVIRNLPRSIGIHRDREYRRP